jgi:hypothetical protein
MFPKGSLWREILHLPSQWSTGIPERRSLPTKWGKKNIRSQSTETHVDGSCTHNGEALFPKGTSYREIERCPEIAFQLTKMLKIDIDKQINNFCKSDYLYRMK